ncbi:MAG TPA: GAF domain-containing protein [Acidimicrobiia bacterium]|nr:GAF domain-containing protein [Acidimicrobiia bacterium]
MAITARRAPAEKRAPRPQAAPTRGRASDEQSYLYRIIQTISAGPDLETILRGTVRLLTEATGCHACFVYFVEGDRLVLRAASNVYAHLEGTVSLPGDKGLAGWVATSRRSAFIKENALEDPRVVYVPEMEEERFQSMVSVPILARAGDVIGVINLHTEAPREFDRDDLEFIEHTASLVAGAIENAHLYQDATRRVAMLTELSRLSQGIAQAASVNELVDVVTTGCQSAIGAERVEIYLADPDGHLQLRSAVPARDDAPVLEAETVRFDDLIAEAGAPPSTEASQLAERLWGPHAEGVARFAPLPIGDGPPGLLAVLCRMQAAGADNVVSAVASHAAVALRHHDLVSRLREENVVKDFFEALSRGDGDTEAVESQAARLGVDLDEPFIVVHAVPWAGRPAERRRPSNREARARLSTWAEVIAALESRLTSALPGTLIDSRATYCRALVKAPRGRERKVAETIAAVHEKIERDSDVSMAIGLSNTCRGAASSPQGFEEAASAAEVGALIKDRPGVYTYDDLGPYRYVLDAEEGVRDRHQERLGRLVEYDQRRGTELLQTLEVYLESRGNIVRTARTVYAHPNTLRQRLARIEQLSGFDLEHEDWLSLGIAIKLVKLRMARESARERERARALRVAREQREGGSDVE